jgi:hypothetical protein
MPLSRTCNKPGCGKEFQVEKLNQLLCPEHRPKRVCRRCKRTSEELTLSTCPKCLKKIRKRKCVECGVSGQITRIDGKQCNRCHRRKRRNGQCRCGKARFWWGCLTCDAAPMKPILVIAIDEQSEQERRFYISPNVRLRGRKFTKEEIADGEAILFMPRNAWVSL